MMIVGQISSAQEAKEMEFIVKVSVVGRRAKALASRPKNWTLKKRKLSAGRALIALANVTKDKKTKQLAKKDAKYFFKYLGK